MTTYTHEELKAGINEYFLQKTGVTNMLKEAFSNDILNAFRTIALDLAVQSFKTGVDLKDTNPIAEMTLTTLELSRTTGLLCK